MTRFQASLDTGSVQLFIKLSAARAWAEGHGTTANVCTIRRISTGKVVAEHRRDPSGDGTRWFRAEVR